MRIARPCRSCAGSGRSQCMWIRSGASLQTGAWRAWRRLRRNSYRTGRGAAPTRLHPRSALPSLTPCRCVRVPCRRALFRRASPRLLRNRPPARTGCTKSSMTGSGSSPVRTGNWCGSTGPKTAGLTRLASPLSLGYAPLVLCPQVRLSDGTTGAGCDGTTAGGLAGSTTGRKTYSVFAIHSN